MSEIIYWIQIGALSLAGNMVDTAPSTSTVFSETFKSQDECEADMMKMRLSKDSSATRVKTSGVFVDGDYNQITISMPVNLTGYGKGFIHFSCVPLKIKG